MHYSTLKKQVLLALVFTFIASATSATPIVFNFTGTIGNQMLDGGEPLKAWAQIPAWNGKTVSGTISMDLEGLQPAVQNDKEVGYSDSAEHDASEQWLNVFINNPDGTSFNFPTFANFPAADFNFSTASMLETGSYSFFSLTRGFTNYHSKKLPYQQIQFRLGTFGDTPYQIYDSLDFNTVNFNPLAANYTNSAYVGYRMDNGDKIEYFFRIDSLTRAESEVPEPGSLMLLLIGLTSLLLGRAKLR